MSQTSESIVKAADVADECQGWQDATEEIVSGTLKQYLLAEQVLFHPLSSRSIAQLVILLVFG
jgi:hypothetical protein